MVLSRFPVCVSLLIAEAAVNFAPQDQLCDILNQSLEFMINPSEKFIKRINFLKNVKQCAPEWLELLTIISNKFVLI